jgi:hypothetical protein
MRLERMTTRFRVGEVFPETEANTALMKLWVASRHVLALKRALLADNAPATVKHEQFLHIFLGIAATLKEAADAFRTADVLRCFATLPSELSSDLMFAREQCDESLSTSIAKRFLVRFRNAVGSHFDAKLLSRGLHELRDETLELRLGGTTFFDSTYPLETRLIEKVLERHGVTMEQASLEFPRITDLGHSLQKLADAAVNIAVERVQAAQEGVP